MNPPGPNHPRASTHDGDLHPDCTETEEPLTTTMLASASPQEQKQMLGERLFPLIKDFYPDLAGKITAMLLDNIENSKLLHMLEDRISLKAKIEEAVAVLKVYKAKRHAFAKKKDEVQGSSEKMKK